MKLWFLSYFSVCIFAQPPIDCQVTWDHFSGTCNHIDGNVPPFNGNFANRMLREPIGSNCEIISQCYTNPPSANDCCQCHCDLSLAILNPESCTTYIGDVYDCVGPLQPTQKPTNIPTHRITPKPAIPTERPTERPTSRPSEKPTQRPTERPSFAL